MRYDFTSGPVAGQQERGWKSRRKPVFPFLGEEKLKPLRTRVYIDGYNFYYGRLKRTSYKWLDLEALFVKEIIPSAMPPVGGAPQSFEMVEPGIMFFTAPILGRFASGHDSLASQQAYHNALEKHLGSRLSIVKGFHSSSTPWPYKFVEGKKPNESEKVRVWKLEEKQTDVNIALQMYRDVSKGAVDQCVLVTNDSDMVPALQALREDTPAQIGVVLPVRPSTGKKSFRAPGNELQKLSHWTYHEISDDILQRAQLPDVVPGRKKPSFKPSTW